MSIETLFRLDGRLVVVGGGSSGIGLGAARCLLEAGARVVLVSRDAARLEAAKASLPAGAPVVAHPADVCSSDDVARLAAAVAEMGGADIVVNSVGMHRRQPLLEVTSQDLEYLWSVNVAGAFALNQALTPQMVAKRYGKIISLCSIGSFVGLKGKAVYAMTKGAMAQYTRSAALDLAEYGIRVNAVAPGFVDTPMTHDLVHSDRHDEFVAEIPLGRIAEPSDLDGTFLYLAGRASDHVTGQLIVVDGGQTVG